MNTIYRMNSSITSLSPTLRNGKHGWYDQFQKHNLLLNNRKVKILIVGKSLVSNLSRYPRIWRKYFINHGALNFGIAGDTAQNILWRVNNFYFSSNLNLKYIFILCGTNNIDHNSRQSIASTIIFNGLAFQKKSHKFQVVWKNNELLAKEIMNFYCHSKNKVAFSKPSYRDITSFSFNYADFLPFF